MLSRTVLIGFLVALGTSTSLALEGLDYSWVLTDETSSPDRTLHILQDIYDGSSDIFHKPKKSQKTEVGKLLDYSKMNLEKCNVEYFQKLIEYATSEAPTFAYGDQIKAYLWEQKNKLREFCLSNGKLINEFAKLPEGPMNDAFLLERRIWQSLRDDLDQIAEGSLKYMEEKSSKKLDWHTSRDELSDMFERYIRPVCELVLREDTRMRFLVWVDDHEALTEYSMCMIDETFNKCRILLNKKEKLLLRYIRIL